VIDCYTFSCRIRDTWYHSVYAGNIPQNEHLVIEHSSISHYVADLVVFNQISCALKCMRVSSNLQLQQHATCSGILTWRHRTVPDWRPVLCRVDEARRTYSTPACSTLGWTSESPWKTHLSADRVQSAVQEIVRRPIRITPDTLERSVCTRLIPIHHTIPNTQYRISRWIGHTRSMCTLPKLWINYFWSVAFLYWQLQCHQHFAISILFLVYCISDFPYST